MGKKKQKKKPISCNYLSDNELLELILGIIIIIIEI